jgi:hypothetical protein
MQFDPREGMMRICKSLLLAVFVLVFMMAATAAEAPTLTFKYKTVRVPGALLTAVGGINNAGVDPHRSPQGLVDDLQEYQFQWCNRGQPPEFQHHDDWVCLSKRQVYGYPRSRWSQELSRQRDQ